MVPLTTNSSHACASETSARNGSSTPSAPWVRPPTGTGTEMNDESPAARGRAPGKANSGSRLT